MRCCFFQIYIMEESIFLNIQSFKKVYSISVSNYQDCGIFYKMSMKKKKKVASTLYEKLKYKKNILFEFIEDLNDSMLDDQRINLIEDILIHTGKNNNQKKKAKKDSKKSAYSVSANLSSSDGDEEDHNHDIYYGLYTPKKQMDEFEECFYSKLKKFNSKIEFGQKFEIDKDELTDNEEINDSQVKLTNSQGEEIEKEDSVFQTTFLIHENHYKRLIRKILFYKFQKMGIWARQAYSQDNRKIFILLKLQGKPYPFKINSTQNTK